MSEANVFFNAIQDALNAHIERMVEAKVKDILTNNKAYEIIMSNLNERIEKLESTANANNFTVGGLETKVKALEEQTTHVPTLMSPEMIVDSMNNAEWLWEKINNYIENGLESRMEQAIEDHCSTYDHDEYDSMYNEWGSESADEFVKDDDFSERISGVVNETLRNATFSISI